MDPLESKQPFQPESAGSARPGCARAALFGCGGLFVICVLLLVLLAINRREITTFAYGKMEENVMARLPPGTSDKDAARVRAGFAGLVEAVQDDSFDPVVAIELNSLMMRFAPENTPTKEDVERLIEVLEASVSEPPAESSLRPVGPAFVPAV